MEELLDYLNNAIASFDSDPADTDFQRGYLEALWAVKEDLFMSPAERIKSRAERLGRKVS